MSYARLGKFLNTATKEFFTDDGAPRHFIEDHKLSEYVVSYEHKKKYKSNEIPFYFEDWFRDFGGLEHPREIDEDGEPIAVNKLTPYQIRFANLDYGFMKKSNKVGVTTSELLGDFHTRLLPRTAGKTCLFSAAQKDTARELLQTLKDKVALSDKYSKFQLKKSQLPASNIESSQERMIIDNPFRRHSEGYILALGSSKSQTYSKMNVNRVHITDPSRMTIKNSQDDYFAGLFSRLANTGGQIKIEGVPGERSGWFFKMSQAMFVEDRELTESTLTEQAIDTATALTPENIGDEYEIPPEIQRVFTGVKVTIDDAVKYGLVSAEWRDNTRRMMSDAMYRRTYMAEFPLGEDNVFRPANNIGTHHAGWGGFKHV